jgi:predicted aspartyl protease
MLRIIAIWTTAVAIASIPIAVMILAYATPITHSPVPGVIWNQAQDVARYRDITQSNSIRLFTEKDGHYVASISVNGSPYFDCLLDTGATLVALDGPTVPPGLSLHLVNADFITSGPFTLANGTNYIRQTWNLRTLSIRDAVDGHDISLRDVKGSFADTVEEHETGMCLIGMSFFHGVKSWKIDNAKAELTLEW